MSDFSCSCVHVNFCRTGIYISNKPFEKSQYQYHTIHNESHMHRWLVVYMGAKLYGYAIHHSCGCIYWEVHMILHSKLRRLCATIYVTFSAISVFSKNHQRDLYFTFFVFRLSFHMFSGRWRRRSDIFPFRVGIRVSSTYICKIKSTFFLIYFWVYTCCTYI